MENPSIQEILQIISDVFMIPVKDIDTNSSSSSVEEWDSMGHLKLIMALEQKFNIEISPDEIAILTSVNQIHCFLIEKKTL